MSPKLPYKLRVKKLNKNSTTISNTVSISISICKNTSIVVVPGGSGSAFGFVLSDFVPFLGFKA